MAGGPAAAAVRTTTEWVRFEHRDEPYGVFSYLSDARAALAPAQAEELNALLAWFVEHLDAPDDADLERFWFLGEAVEHIERARRLADLVRAAGIPIVERRTKRIPGKVKWQDPHQVAVLTYRDAPRPGRD